MTKKTPIKTKAKARVTSVSVARLYNTGNYTNVKYDIAAEVPQGASAVEALRQLVYVLQMLKPINRPNCLDQFERASKKMESEQSDYEKENLPKWREEIQQYQARKAARDAAVLSLDDLGGSSQKRDAKETWEDDDYEY